jgi:ATP-dependent 26S proteasome regulatory subunit
MESTQPPYLPSIRIGPLPITSFSNILPTHWPRILRFGRILQPTEGEQSFSAMQSKELIQDRLNERKLASILEAMVSAGQEKRSRQRLSNSTPDDGGAAPRSASDKTIIQIRDYRELERTPSGRALLKMLHNIVQDRRREGERITILGTTSNEAPQSLYTKNGVRVLQSRSDESLERTIVVPPLFSEAELKVLNNDKAARNREVNIRHLRDVIRRRDGEEGGPAILSVPDGWHFSDEEPRISEIEVGPWSFDRVHRVATVALGALTSARKEISIRDIMAAVNLINESDQIKVSWALQEKEYLKKRDEVANNETNGEGTGSGKAKPIPKNLTTHEKKLVAGIIDPMNIHTGFSAVCAPSETIEAMKTLTSLSLIRPEAFKYGVLATDRIPGVLLYGPPGTGKTLLARAVAKESGATVLEVSGGDIFNMYVGEGEKNVKAIFSLAKKLSPCVIFIDEADAIFGSRQSFSNRSSHREIINQFLKEWADMDSTAFIMIATNRPFDLDDAVLRRLPRRILIDLPTPGERLKILQIHLANEILDETVILKEIADSGALYSGSDLKNLCVSAALNCVKDENAEFEKTGSYPDKRILKKHHFEKAMNEITASISDDMGSLGMIRKFDDKYGERAGRKKTKRTWGFEVGQTSQSHSEGRVRVD